MKPGPVELANLARELLAGPHRNEILYPGTNRVNRAALARVLEAHRFAAAAAAEHPHHVPSRGDKGGWKSLKTATPGRESGAFKDKGFVW